MLTQHNGAESRRDVVRIRRSRRQCQRSYLRGSEGKMCLVFTGPGGRLSSERFKVVPLGSRNLVFSILCAKLTWSGDS